VFSLAYTAQNNSHQGNSFTLFYSKSLNQKGAFVDSLMSCPWYIIDRIYCLELLSACCGSLLAEATFAVPTNSRFKLYYID